MLLPIKIKMEKELLLQQQMELLLRLFMINTIIIIDTKINNISIEKNTYNQYGQLVKIEKPSEQYTYEYDDYGRKIKEINNITTLTTEYTYDSFDNILEQKDSGGKKISYEYDEYNRMIKTIDAYGRTETQIYDINSNVIEVKNFSNETEKY